MKGVRSPQELSIDRTLRDGRALKAFRFVPRGHGGGYFVMYLFMFWTYLLPLHTHNGGGLRLLHNSGLVAHGRRPIVAESIVGYGKAVNMSKTSANSSKNVACLCMLPISSNFIYVSPAAIHLTESAALDKAQS